MNKYINDYTYEMFLHPKIDEVKINISLIRKALHIANLQYHINFIQQSLITDFEIQINSKRK